MPAWSHLLRWFAPRLLLLLATLLAPGCGTSTYNIPPAELQRLTQVPPSQRGQHVRVYTPGLVPAATPPPAVAARPAVPAPPAPEAVVDGERVGGSSPAGEVYLPAPESPAPPVILSVDLAPPAFVPVPSVPAPTVRPRPAPTRFPPMGSARPSMRPPVSGHAIAPRAAPHFPSSASPRAAPVVHASGGHAGGWHGSPHASGGGGGGGGAAVGVLVGAIVLIALVAIIAENSKPKPFDGWIRTSPEHPVKLTYTSGSQREVRLCDLKPEDAVGVSSAVLDEMDGSINQLESAQGNAPAARPPERLWPAHDNGL